MKSVEAGTMMYACVRESVRGVLADKAANQADETSHFAKSGV